MQEPCGKVQIATGSGPGFDHTGALMPDMDLAYANSAFIAGSELLPGLWSMRAAAFRSRANGQLGLAYGLAERQKFDLFLPDETPLGLLVFVHGGYWLEFGRDSWSHLAVGALARGWACAIPSYTLAPDARISQITQEVATAVRAAAAMVDGPVVVTGHSAGGHLAARMGCADLALDMVRRVVPISPIAELAPLMQTGMQKGLRLTEAECAHESPARLLLRDGCQAHVWVGTQERPAFLWQARLLSEAWDCPWTPQPDRNHFSVIDDLAEPGSALLAACLGGF